MLTPRSMLRKYEMYLTRQSCCFSDRRTWKGDQGGGGTIAYVHAQNKIAMSVIDSGVAVCHACLPYEVKRKSDVYDVYRRIQSLFKRYEIKSMNIKYKIRV